MRNLFLVLLSIILFASACKTPKPAQYLGNAPFDTARFSKAIVPEPIIQKGDLLGIVIYSDNVAASSIYNQPLAGQGLQGATNGSGSSQAGAPGYLVDYNGNVQLQTLGNVKAEGLSRAQLADTLKMKFVPYLTNPYVTIKFLNYKVTVMGEVSKPGLINFPGEQLTVLQALSLAGDVTLYGLKDSLLLIREYNGKREFANVDATKPDLMLSPYYYLQQNDVIIVKPNAKKPTISAEVTARRLSIATALVAMVTSIAVVISILR